jgi:hypothetical protein
VSHLGLFLLEKQMIIKGSQSIDASFDGNGYILLEQYSIEFGKTVTILITLEQYNNIENFVFRNKDELELLWNDGVKDDSNS